MRHRTGVFRELRGAQHAHVFDAFHRTTAGTAHHVGGKFLIAENCKAFFQR